MDDLMVAQQLEHFQALRDRLRCKEIRVVGAHEWRNPDEDLPTDFRANRGRRQWDATE